MKNHALALSPPDCGGLSHWGSSFNGNERNTEPDEPGSWTPNRHAGEWWAGLSGKKKPSGKRAWQPAH